MQNMIKLAEMFESGKSNKGNFKDTFHRTGKKALKEIAELLGLSDGTFDIRSNKGGDGVIGEVTLHADSIYIQFCDINRNSFFFRSCKGRKDYGGGTNNWTSYSSLKNPETIEKFKSVMNSYR